MDNDLNVFSGIVVDLLDLDLPFVVGTDYGVDQGGGGGGEGDLIDHQGAFVDLADLGPHPDLATPDSFAVF